MRSFASKFYLGVGIFALSVNIAAPEANAQVVTEYEGQNETPPADSDAAEGALGVIIVTAERRAVSSQDVPVTLQAFSPDFLEDHNIVAVQDLQTVTPGLAFRTSTNDRATPLITLRGQSQTRADLGKQPNVGLYVDEVYQSTGTGVNFPSGLFDVERVEVLKGPQGTLYGRNSTGGAINIITRQPTDVLEGAIELGVGNFGTMYANGMLNIPVSSGVSSRFVTQYYSTDGYNTDLTTGDMGTTASYTRGAVEFEASPALSFIARGFYQKYQDDGQALHPEVVVPNTPATIQAAAEIGAPFTPAGFEAGRQAILSTIPRSPFDIRSTPGYANYTDVESYGGSFHANFDATDWLQIKSITAYLDVDVEGGQESDGTQFLIIHQLPPQSGRDYKQFTQELQLNGNLLNDRLEFSLGGFYYALDGDDRSWAQFIPAINPSTPSRDDPSIVHALIDIESIALYGQATYALTDTLSVIGGLRFTKEENTLTSFNRDALQCQVPVVDRVGGECKGIYPNEYDDLSYTAGLQYEPNENLLFYGRVASAFKAGGQNVRGSTIEGSFQPFDPEYATNYEAGMKGLFFNRTVRLNAAAFYTDYTDIQRSIIIPFSGGVTNIVRNAAAATIKGVELDGVIDIAEHVSVGGSFSYIDAGYDEYVDGNGTDLSDTPFPNTPEFQVNGFLSAEYPVSYGNYGLHVSGYWQSEVDYDPENHTAFSGPTAVDDGHFLLDARVSLYLEDADFELALFGENLTDERYVVGGLDITGSLGIGGNVYGAPRTFGIEFTKRF